MEIQIPDWITDYIKKTRPERSVEDVVIASLVTLLLLTDKRRFVEYLESREKDVDSFLLERDECRLTYL